MRRSPCGERGLKYNVVTHNQICVLSLPVRGAWIEISSKFTKVRQGAVAPRAGSVD